MEVCQWGSQWLSVTRSYCGRSWGEINNMRSGACIDGAWLRFLGTFTHVKESIHILPWCCLSLLWWPVSAPSQMAAGLSVSLLSHRLWTSASSSSLAGFLCWMFWWHYNIITEPKLLWTETFVLFLTFLFTDRRTLTTRMIFTGKIWLCFLCIKFFIFFFFFLLTWVSKSSFSSQESTVLSSY